MFRRSFFVIFCTAMFWNSGCEKMSSKDRSAFLPFANTISNADAVTLFEGLEPGNSPDPKTSDGRAPIQIHRSYFDPREIALKPDHANALKSLSVSSDSFFSTDESLKCAFHADFAISFKKDVTVCHVLICFTCGQVLFEQNGELFGTRIRNSELNRFAGILQVYRNSEYGPLPTAK